MGAFRDPVHFHIFPELVGIREDVIPLHFSIGNAPFPLNFFFEMEKVINKKDKQIHLQI